MKTLNIDRSIRVAAMILSALFIPGMPSHAQETVSGTRQLVYKQIDTVSLSMDIYYPPDMDQAGTCPAMIFFFGGGWKGGSVDQFKPHALYFSGRGIICILADYRVESRQGTTPFESLKDAKSAIRFIRKNAGQLQVDPDRIIAAGGSAGGHLAAATALISQYNETGEDLSVSCIPNALVLFNPVIDNGPGGYGYERIGDAYKDFSPLHNITRNVPPTIFFLGTDDNLIPVETAKYYQKVMEKVGGRCELYLYEGQGHGFFNFRNRKYYDKTVRETEKFLISLGYLNSLPDLRP
jgi:acetyl esterase